MYKQSRIIKAQNVSFVSSPTDTGMDFTPFTMNEGEKKGKDPPEKRIKERELEKILQQMEQKVIEARQNAYDEGFSEGVRKGSETEKHEVLTAMNTVQTLMKEVSTFKEKTLAASEKELLDLCFSMAEMVVHQEVSQDKSVVLSVLKAAFRNIVERENIKIRLNPDDYQYMVEIKSNFINSMDGVRNVFFEEDGSISRGGAIIETSSGEVDARISEQLNEIKSGILNLQSS